MWSLVYVLKYQWLGIHWQISGNLKCENMLCVEIQGGKCQGLLCSETPWSGFQVIYRLLYFILISSLYFFSVKRTFGINHNNVFRPLWWGFNIAGHLIQNIFPTLLHNHEKQVRISSGDTLPLQIGGGGTSRCCFVQSLWQNWKMNSNPIFLFECLQAQNSPCVLSCSQTLLECSWTLVSQSLSVIIQQCLPGLGCWKY